MYFSFPRIFLGRRFLLLSSVLVCFSYFASFVTSGAVQCFESQTFCFQATFVQDNQSLVDIYVNTTIKSGWISIGLGSSMKSSNVYVLSKSPTGSWELSEGTTVARTSPEIRKNTTILFYQPKLSTKTESMENMAFRCAADSGFQSLSFKSGPISMIYAIYEGEGVSSTSLPMHTKADQFMYDMSSTSSQIINTGTSVRGTLIKVHGILLSIAWSIFSFAGLFVARYCKNHLRTYWFKIHVGLNILVVLCTLAGITILFAGVGAELSSFHSIFGTSILVIMVLQLVLGMYIHFTFNPHRAHIPIGDRLHWWLGYILILVSPVNVMTGHFIYGTEQILLYGNAIIIGLFVAAILWAQVKIGQQHEHSAQTKVLYN